MSSTIPITCIRLGQFPKLKVLVYGYKSTLILILCQCDEGVGHNGGKMGVPNQSTKFFIIFLTLYEPTDQKSILVANIFNIFSITIR